MRPEMCVCMCVVKFIVLSLTSCSGVGEGLREPRECLRGVEVVWSPRAWDSVCPVGAGRVAGLSH